MKKNNNAVCNLAGFFFSNKRHFSFPYHSVATYVSSQNKSYFPTKISKQFKTPKQIKKISNK